MASTDVRNDATLHSEYRFAKEKYVMDADKMLNDLPTDRDLTRMPVPWSSTSGLTKEYFMCDAGGWGFQVPWDSVRSKLVDCRSACWFPSWGRCLSPYI